MGVPRLFRYLSQRYPCCLDQITNSQVPDFDNFYLDCNGIIHFCSHSPQMATSVMTEEEIFINILNYIDILFKLIKPKKLFFLAVDGVAPQAKMNNQRSRRFLKIKEMEEQKKKKQNEGKSPTEEFDSNCITPGTIFMERLHEHLKYFCTSKVSNDPEWQTCKIILSGHQTPGEGEHKIMNYIRYMKTLPEYNPNLRHCIFGADADLIILGLSTHEPRFFILREKLEKKKNGRSKPFSLDEIEFYLTHLELLRDYLDLEFKDLKEKISFAYDLENIIDDWILMTFLLGNDFIPNPPDFDINRNGLTILYKTYKEVLPTLDGYLNECGELNLPRFQQFMAKLGEIDKEVFEQNYFDLMCPEAEMKDSGNDLNDLDKYETMEFLDEDSDGTFLEEFHQKKRDYYLNKMGHREMTEELMQKQAEEYIRAIQWNLYYYYLGCQSWTWFYPYHYSPFLSDIVNFKNFTFHFEMGKPLPPLYQLMAVLPPGSKWCLPECFQHLMISPSSPIRDFYPHEFEIDLNSKQFQWEAVVLIPFVDQKKLKAAVEPLEKELTKEEKRRNKTEPFYIFTYTKKNLGVYNGTRYFPNIENNHASVVCQEELLSDKGKSKAILLEFRSKFSNKQYSALTHFPHTISLGPSKLALFSFPSREETMSIFLNKMNETPPLKILAQDLLGKIVFSNWPYLFESKVIAVSDWQVKFSLANGDKIKQELLNKMGQVQWKKNCESLVDHYLKKKGVVLGQVKILVYVAQFQGHVYSLTSSKNLTPEKVWSSTVLPWPLQTIVLDLKRDREPSSSTESKTVEEAFPIGSTVFMLGNTYFGSMGKIVENSRFAKTNRLTGEFETIKRDPIIERLPKLKPKEKFLSCKDVATSVGISCRLLSRITGYFVLELADGEKVENSTSKVNIGLKMKLNNQNEELPGYTKKMNDFWMYSTRAKEVVGEYVKNFPKLFVDLSKNLDKQICLRSDILPGPQGLKELEKIVKWIKQQSYQNIEFVKCGSEIVTPDVVEEIKNLMTRENDEIALKTINVTPNYLYKSDLVTGNSEPVKMARHNLLDRVVLVKSGSSAPVGMRGIIIGIQKAVHEADYVYEILFDKPFSGGKKLESGERRSLRIPPNFFLNISDANQRNKSTSLPKEIESVQKKLESIEITKPESKLIEIDRSNKSISADTKWNDSVSYEKIWSNVKTNAKPQDETIALKKILKIEAGKMPVSSGPESGQPEMEDPVNAFFKAITKSKSPKMPEKCHVENGSNLSKVSKSAHEPQTSKRYFNQLCSHYESQNLPRPIFRCQLAGNKIIARVHCQNGEIYSGLPCEDEESAIESASLQTIGAIKIIPHGKNDSSNEMIDKRIRRNQMKLKKALFRTGSDKEGKMKCHPVDGGERHNQNSKSHQIPHSLPYPPKQWVRNDGKRKNASQNNQMNASQQKKSGEGSQKKKDGKSCVGGGKSSESALEFVPLQAIIGKRNCKPIIKGHVASSSIKVNSSNEIPKKVEVSGSVVGQTSETRTSTKKPKKHRIAANLNFDPNLY